jgi:hypothetical protein
VRNFASRVFQLSSMAAPIAFIALAIASADAVPPSSAMFDRVDLRSDATLDDRIDFGALDGSGEVYFNIRGGFEYQFDADIDGGGSFRSHRLGASITAVSDITPDFDVRFAFGYEFDHYTFDGNTGIGGFNPWRDIHTIGFGVIFGTHLTNEWKLFGGPVFQFSAESGASFSDGFIGGGVIGTTYRVSPDLLLGGGIGVVTQIERSVRIYPVIMIDWQISNQLKLTTHTATNAAGDSAIELVYDWGGGFETAIGGSYRFRRFRLDDSGIAPEGVGQHTSMPIWLRFTYHFSPNFSINAYGGAVFAGELQLRDSGGSLIGKEDYDPAGLVGISGSIRF